MVDMLKENHKILVLLIVLVTVRGIIYISIVPPWLAPDEATHFEAIRLIGQEKLWPTEDVYLATPMHPEMHASFEKFRIWQMSGLGPPPGDPSSDPYIYYYPARNSGSVLVVEEYPLIYHFLLSPISALSESLNIVQQLYLLRLSSLFFTVLIVVVSWFFVRTVFPHSTMYAVAVSSFLIFLPMHLHVNTSVNTDVITTLFVSLYFLVVAKIICERISLLRVIVAGGLLILAILTKPTALFIFPTSVVASIIYLARRFRWPPRYLTLLLIATVIFTFLGAVLLFQIANGGRGIARLSFSADSINLTASYFSQASLAVYMHTIRWGFLSFWGLFGWANIPIPGFWVWMLWRICLLVGIGVVIFLFRHIFGFGKRNVALKSHQKEILLILLFGLIFALISVYTPIIATQSIKWGPPSRYFFPALIPLALYFFLGFQQLVPARIYNLTLPLWLAGLSLYDSLVLAYVLIPSIYG